MPRRVGLRIWNILKKIQLRSEHGVEKLRSDHGVEKLGIWDWTMQADNWGREEFSAIELGFLPLRRRVRSKTPRDVPNVGGSVSIVWYERPLRIVSLFSCRKTELRRQSHVRIWTTESPVYYFRLCFCICICTVVIDIIMFVVCNMSKLMTDV